MTNSVQGGARPPPESPTLSSPKSRRQLGVSRPICHSPTAPRVTSELQLSSISSEPGRDAVGHRIHSSEQGSDVEACQLGMEVQSLASVRDLIASSFLAAQRALAESHERALGLLSRCVEDARGREEVSAQAKRSSTTLPNGFQAIASHGTPRGTSHSCKLQDLEGEQSSAHHSHVPVGFQSEPVKTFTDKKVFPPDESAPVMPVDGLAQEDTREMMEDVDSDSEVCQQARDVLGPLPGEVEEANHNSILRTTSFRSGDVALDTRRTSVMTDNSDKESKQSSFLDRKANVNNNHRMSMASAQSMEIGVTFELLPVWTRWTNALSSKRKMKTMRKLTRRFSQCIEPVNRPWWKDALHPGSWIRAAWECVSIVLVLYDMVIIPLHFFDIPEGGFIAAMRWVTRIFWTLDIGATFCTGLPLYDGTVELRFTVIAWRYIKTWFSLDIGVVSTDWLETLIAGGEAGTVTRAVRGIRMVRLVRIARMGNFFAFMAERSEQMLLVAGIIKVMLIIMGLGHIIACTWYGVSRMDRPDTWTKVHHFEDAPFDYQYTTCLHWAFLQFAGGTDEIVPQNTPERLYSIIVFLVAFVVAAVFVGRLTSSMTQLHMLASKDLEKIHVLRRYLSKNQISSRLARRVQHNAHHMLFERQRFMEESRVELLQLLSEPLRVELHFELFSPVLAVHPFFRAYIDACPQVIRRVCHEAVSQLLLSAGDIVFMLGEVPTEPRMLIVCNGKLTYHYVSGTATHVEVGMWISEAALWTSWTYRGMLTAASDCRLCVLNATKFQELADTFDHPDFDLRTYAQAFIQSLNSGTMEWSDLPFNNRNYDIKMAIEEMSDNSTTPYWMVDQSLVESSGGHSKGNWWSNLQRHASRAISVSSSKDLAIVPQVKPMKSVLMAS